MRIISYLILLIIVLLGITFAILNHAPVPINYYIGQQTLPLSMLLILAFAVGGLIGLLIGFWMFVKLKIKNYRLRQQLKVVKKEVENLRAIPLQDRH